MAAYTQLYGEQPQEALHEIAAQFQELEAIFETLVDGVAIYGTDARLIKANAAAYR